MPHYPAARLLVSPVATTPLEGFTTIRSKMLNGFPHVIELPDAIRLSVTLPTGMLADWLDADSTALVSASDDERTPFPMAESNGFDSALRPALRITARKAGQTLGIVPFSLDVSRITGDDGDQRSGAALEIVLMDWQVRAGTVRGIGDFDSYVTLAWRRADRSVDVFGPPVINPNLVGRLPLIFMIKSQLGLKRKSVIKDRFLIPKQAFHEFI